MSRRMRVCGVYCREVFVEFLVGILEVSGELEAVRREAGCIEAQVGPFGILESSVDVSPSEMDVYSCKRRVKCIDGRAVSWDSNGFQVDQRSGGVKGVGCIL